MAKEKIDPEEYVSYYTFWLWEYQRRNGNYRKDYKLYKKALRGMTKRRWVTEVKVGKDVCLLDRGEEEEMKKFFRKHGRRPKDPKQGIDSEKLLNIIIEKAGGIRLKTEEQKRQYSWKKLLQVLKNEKKVALDGLISVVGTSPYTSAVAPDGSDQLIFMDMDILHFLKGKSTMELRFDPERLLSSFTVTASVKAGKRDLRDHLEQLQKELAVCYWNGHIELYHQKRLRWPSPRPRKELVEIHQKALQEMEDSSRKASNDLIEYYLNHRSDDVAFALREPPVGRAMGLWLRDYMRKKKDAKQRCSRADAIDAMENALQEKFSDTYEGLLGTVLYNKYLRLTRQCIEKVQVRPIG